MTAFITNPRDLPRFRILSDVLRTGIGNGNNQYKQDRPTKEREPRNRVERALKSYKPATADKQRAAEKNEKKLAKTLQGQTTDNNKPVDTVVVVKGRVHGLEVKTIIDAVNDKITMHPESRKRKLSWARKNKARLHTVVYDERPGSKGVYYRQGVGSFRLSGMTEVKNEAHLRELVGL